MKCIKKETVSQTEPIAAFSQEDVEELAIDLADYLDGVGTEPLWEFFLSDSEQSVWVDWRGFGIVDEFLANPARAIACPPGDEFHWCATHDGQEVLFVIDDWRPENRELRERIAQDESPSRTVVRLDWWGPGEPKVGLKFGDWQRRHHACVAKQQAAREDDFEEQGGLFTPQAEAAVAGESPKISNAMVIVGDDGKEDVAPLSMAEIIAANREVTGNWPRRVGQSLFVHDGDNGVCWLNRPSALFGYLARTHGVIDWRRNANCVAKDELFSELQRTATAYEAIETFPHEPPIASCYYTCPPVQPGDGMALEAFLDFFCPETPADRGLLKAATVTCVWGGSPGTRPAFLFVATAGRGKGKMKVAQSIASLFGGWVDISANEDIGVIKQRLLTPDAATLRVMLLDNVKTTRFSSAELEGLITSRTISGKQLYVGNATRWNYLTPFITLNGASLSTDMAQRTVEIRLAEPVYQADWEERLQRFVSGDHCRHRGVPAAAGRDAAGALTLGDLGGASAGSVRQRGGVPGGDSEATTRGRRRRGGKRDHRGLFRLQAGIARIQPGHDRRVHPQRYPCPMVQRGHERQPEGLRRHQNRQATAGREALVADCTHTRRTQWRAGGKVGWAACRSSLSHVL